MRRATALAVPVRTLALYSYISSHFVAIHSLSVHCSRKSQKTLIMLKIFYAGSLGLSPAILAQFTFKLCVAARNRKKLRKGCSKSSKQIPHPSPPSKKSSSLVLVMISSMFVPICNCFTLDEPMAIK